MNIRYCILMPLLLAGLYSCEQRTPDSAAADNSVSPPLNHAGGNRGEVPLRMVFDRFTTDDGLCSNTVIRIFQDSRGFLWLGTDAGLNRYDGYTFKQYQHDADNPNSLLENNVMALAEDGKGHIWVLSANGLSELDPFSDIIYTYTDTLTKGRINTNSPGMVLAAGDIIWIDGCLVFDIREKQFRAPSLPGEKPFFKYAINSRNEVFGVFQTNMVGDSLTSRTRTYIAKQAPDDPFRLNILYDTLALDMWGFGGNTLRMDSDRYLRAGTQDGLLQEFDLQTRKFSQIRPRTGTIKDMCFVPKTRTLWLTGWIGLVHCDLNKPPDFSERRYGNNDREPAGLPAPVVISVLEDRDGNVWAGVLNSGLCRYSPSKNKFERYQYTYPDTAGLPGKSVEALCFDKYDRLWVGTNKGLCRLDDRRSATFKTFRQPRPLRPASNHDAVRSIAEDSTADRLYMGYWGVPLDYFDTKKEQYFPLPLSNTSESSSGKHWMQTYNAFITSVKRSNDGQFYYSDFGHFLHQYNPKSQKLTTFCSGDIANSNRLRQLGYHQLSLSVCPQAPDRIWIGNTEGTSIIRLNLTQGDVFGEKTGAAEADAFCSAPYTGKFTCFRPDEKDTSKLRSGIASCFFQDSRQGLWVGTGAGLHFVRDPDKGIFERFGPEHGFSDLNIQAILEDNRGRLWVSTYDGICCFDPETKRVTAHYDADDGLQGNQFNLNSAAKNSWGLMAFGGPNGFNLFHPDSIFHDARIPTVKLTNFEVNGIAHSIPKSGVELVHQDKNLAFEFSAMDFSNPKRNRYQFYLEGYDTGWCAPTPVRQVRYTNLAPGKYTFRVRGCNADNLWSRNDLVFPVTILAPWWATWWFRAMLAVAAFGVVLLLVRRREAWLRRKLEEDERTIRYLQVQTLQAQMNPHFIFNVLGVMQHQIIKSKPQEANRQLGNLSTLIRRFLDSSVSSAPMVKGLSQNDIPLEEEIELLTMYAEFEVLQRQEKFEGKGFSIEVDESVNVSTVRIPPMIIQPYIENAVKHGIRYLPEGRKGFVRIRFSREGDALRCTVEDNGVGREEAARIQAQSHSIYKSHGTRLVKERTEILNQIGYDIAIETRDRPGGGTIVTITIKD